MRRHLRRRTRLRDLLRDGSNLLVLTAPGTGAASIPDLGRRSGVEVRSLTRSVARPQERDTVMLVVRDLVALRHAITGVANVGTARRVVVWFEREVTRVPSLVPHPRWPPLEEMVVNRSPDRFVLLVFSAQVQVRPVLMEIARAASPSGKLAVGWPTVGARRDEPARWPPADPSAKVAMLPRLLDQSVDFPPDLMLLSPDATDRAGLPDADHPVLGRPTRVTVVEPDVTWEECAELFSGGAIRERYGRGIALLGVVDEQIINPIGFERDPRGGTAMLADWQGHGLAVGADRSVAPVRMDPDLGVSEVDLPVLRDFAAVRLGWSGGRGPHNYCRAVVGLAMAGVPLVSDAVPPWAEHVLVPELVSALSQPVDLTDRLRREEHSVRLRRAALRSYGSRPWRRRLAEPHGLQQPSEPTVTVVLATRRPEMLPFALRQIARQRRAEFELVVATHGFVPDPGALAAFQDACPAELSTVTVEKYVPFGDVLNEAAVHATGDLVLKMDDDDWYGRDFIGDLCLAHGYSGADLVGCFPEFTYLEQLGLTTRRAAPSEVYLPYVAGGTMLIDRGTLRSLGGFRRTVKYVDANLLSAVSTAGGHVYRAHGLGYVLRRGRSGHTWDPGLGYFLSPERANQQWRGFRPSELLELDDADRPTGQGGLDSGE